MAKKFLTGIETSKVTQLDLPVNGTDATNKTYVDDLVTSKDFGGVITRDGNGRILSVQVFTNVAKTTSITYTVARDASNYINTVTDQNKTRTIARDGNNKITGWSIA